MQVDLIRIADIKEDQENARIHPLRNTQAIAESLTRFGQQKPIVVDGRNVVIAGNGTLAAARSLGWTEIACVRTELVGAEARAFALADNRIAELAEWDRVLLAEQLPELDLAGIGFDHHEVDNLLADLEAASLVEIPPDEGASSGGDKPKGGAVVKLAVHVDDLALVEDVLSRVAAINGGSRGTALAEICRAYDAQKG